MNNVFQIGGQVKGDSFIGRKPLIQSIRKSFVENDKRTAKSFVGLTRIGKTSLVKNSFIDIPKGVICIYEDLNERSNYVEIWQDICLDIQEYLYKNPDQFTLCDVGDFKQLLDDIAKDDCPWIKLSRSVKRVFSQLASCNIKTILILDEFDNASFLFNEGTKHFELFRSVFSDARYNVSAITLSRRNLYTIEGATYQSSTFHNVLDIVPLKGFDDNDMIEYFSVFEREGIHLNESQKARIVYYAGNLPYLLSILGHYIIEVAESGADIDVDKIFLEKCKAINDYYRDCIKHLERDEDLQRIIPFIIGPNVGVTKNDKDELYNLGYFYEIDGKLVAISEYFSLFLSTEKLKINIWDNIIQLEKRLKLLLEENINLVAKHYTVSSDTINGKMVRILEKVEDVTEKDISRYEAYIRSNLRDFNIESTYIDVMSLSDVVKILRDCWNDVFSKFFNLDPYSRWDNKLSKCAVARNPVAHGHEEYLSDLDKQEVDTYCKQVFDILSETFHESVNKAQSSKQQSMLMQENTVDYSLLGQTAKMLIEDISSSGEARGIVNGTYNGIIPKSYLRKIDSNKLINHEIQVVVKSINAGVLSAQPLDK